MKKTKKADKAAPTVNHEAAQDALAAQLTGVMGEQSAQLIQSATANAANQTSGTWAAVFGLVTLLVTAFGVFGEMQSALNSGAKRELNFSAHLGSCGESRSVAALGFLLIVSLAISAAISAFGEYLNTKSSFCGHNLGRSERIDRPRPDRRSLCGNLEVPPRPASKLA